MSPEPSHTCWLSDKDRETLEKFIKNADAINNIVSVANQIKGGLLRAFALGALAVMALVIVGAGFGVKQVVAFVRMVLQ